MPMTRVASAQLALLKTTATHGSRGVVINDRSATARTKNAMGTTTRFASKDSGVTKWKYQRINGNEPIHAAKRHRCGTAKPFITGVHPSAWTPHQALRQKRIRNRTPMEKPEEPVGEQHNCANHCEGELKPSGKQFVCVPTENEKRGCRKAVQQKYSPFEKVTADED